MYEDILVKQNPHWKGEEFPAGMEREIKSEVVRSLDTEYIIAITGVRKSGKSCLLFELMDYLLKNIPPENVLYADFDDPVFLRLRSDPGGLENFYRDYLKFKNPKGMKYLLFDEIRNVPGWEEWVRTSVDREDDMRLVVTGSNAVLLSSSLTDFLNGRSIHFELFPFNLREVLRLKNEDVIISPDVKEVHMRNYGIRDVIRYHLDEVLKWGGFPGVVLPDGSQKEAALKEYYKEILYREIIPRFEVRHADKLEEISYFVMNNITNAVSYHNIGKLAGIHENTVRDYMSFFEKAYLSFQVTKFSYSQAEEIKNPKKVYFIDTGIRNAVSLRFFRQDGELCENLVFIDLRRRGKKVHYWKGKGEVDFVVKEGMKIEQLVQVCWGIYDVKTRRRKFAGLVEAMKALDISEGVMITDNDFGEEVVDGKKISVVPLWCWLLRK